MKLLGLAVIVVVVGACGSSSASNDTGTIGMGFTAAQLCALATSMEVGAAIGRTVPAGVPTGVNAPACVWTADDGSGATIAATDPGSVGKIPFGLQGVSGAHVTPIPHLGDAAFFASGGSNLSPAELDMKKGGRAVTITAGIAGGNMTQGQQEAAELAIATAAAGRM
jgi:hypothetical protein